MNKLLLSVITLAAIVMYLVGAFTSWDVNPTNWSPFLRLILAASFIYFSTGALLQLDGDDEE